MKSPANFGRLLPLTLLLVATLSGCASAPPIAINTLQQEQLCQQHLAKIATIGQFSLQGRIAVNTEGKGYSGGLTWAHAAEADKLEMFSPLGGQVADITKNPTEVTLTTSDGKQYSAVNAETLTENTLGWRLPLSGLVNWVIGRPATSSAPTERVLDAQGRIVKLKQDGWDIEYSQYSAVDGYDLPSRIALRSAKINLKLVVDKWSSLATQIPQSTSN